MHSYDLLSDSKRKSIERSKKARNTNIDDVEKPRAMSSYGAGSVIGYGIDKGVSRRPEHWSHATESIELCIFSEEDFDISVELKVDCMVYAKESIN
jgi:hypothetical protein